MGAKPIVLLPVHPFNILHFPLTHPRQTVIKAAAERNPLLEVLPILVNQSLHPQLAMAVFSHIKLPKAFFSFQNNVEFPPFPAIPFILVQAKFTKKQPAIEMGKEGLVKVLQ